MATATILCTQTSFGIGGYGSSDENTILVGKADGYTENARIRFAALNPSWAITSIKLQMRRNDGYETRVLRFGTNASSSFDNRNNLDWKKNFTVSDGYSFKTFDLTPYKDIIQGYTGNWYVHITHGSGDRSYCTFNGGTSSNRPRLVIEYEDASVVVPDNKFVIGQAKTFTVGFEGSGMSHRLSYSVGGASGQITADGVSEFAGGASVTWTPPIELADEIVDTDVGAIQINVETYVDGVLRSTVPFEFALEVPADMVPIINSATISLVNPVGDAVGEYVQGRSQARAVISASSVHGATITRYQLEITAPSGASLLKESESSSILSDVLNETGAMNVTVRVFDSRGRSAESVMVNKFTVYPYSPPTLVLLKLERALNEPDYPASNNGQYIKYTVGCVFSPINGKNIKSGSVRFKPSGGSYGDPVSLDSLMAGSSSYSLVLAGLLGNNDIGSGAYIVEVTLSDRYNSITVEAGLASRLIAYDLHASGLGMAVGGEAVTPGLFDVYIPARFRGSVKFDNPAAALANLAPFCILTRPVSETFSYNSTSRWWTFNWQEIDTNGGFQFKQGGSNGTRNIGVIVPEDGVYYAALSVRFSTADTESGFWMRIAVFPEDTVFPARNYFLDSDGISARETITQVIPAWSSSNTIGNAAGAFRCYAGEIILPYGYLNSASKQLSSETRFWVWKIG